MAISMRKEIDSLGPLNIPSYAYYGIRTMRAHLSFPSVSLPLHKELIVTLAQVKKAAAVANIRMGKLPRKLGGVMVLATDEVIRGLHTQNFILDSLHGGSSEAFNANMNEVIANRALELLLENKGDYRLCSPQEHVNLSQSAECTVSLAIRVALHRQVAHLARELEKLKARFSRLERRSILSEEKRLYAGVVRNLRAHRDRLQAPVDRLLGVRVMPVFLEDYLDDAFLPRMFSLLSESLQLDLRLIREPAEAADDGILPELSASLSKLSSALAKLCTKLLRAPLAKDGETMPERLETLRQVALQLAGNHRIVATASLLPAGTPQASPYVANTLLQSVTLLEHALFCLGGIVTMLEAAAEEKS
ncbi:lyase family protein [Cohnella thailandensis]|uniref:Fumarate lyase N-terminal domain-containing protein n=1 Tax=Cohnella thailandensis TaxID=557557 RepID=A0A841T0Q9_9BACL|nr:lyase family protein [Cohnella thailandensis]MBB6636135.1 hypothetical protein [Cohnella thailandensis]MBP1973896.1 aspartate ammonia-lyase [Cohnella thailandensis]